MSKKVGVVVDNDFDHDIRVTKEVNILKEAGYDVHVLCFGFEGSDYDSHEGLTVDRINISRKRKNRLYFFNVRFPFYRILWKKNIKEFIVRHDLDIIHVHDLYLSKPAKKAITNCGKRVPLILDLHENYPFAILSYNWTKGWLRNFLANPKKWKAWEFDYLIAADKIIVLAEHFKEQLIDEYPKLNAKEFIVYPNVIDIKKFDQYPVDHSKSRPFKGLTLLYFGIIAERRGVFDTVKALEKVNSKGHDVNLLIIGPVDKADQDLFQEILNTSSSKKSIKYIPWIELSELTTYLNLIDVCISPIHKNPQHESGVANKVFQYMYGRKPLIVSDSRPQMELVKKHNCGLSFSNIDELVESIEYLLKNPVTREELGDNAYHALIHHYATESQNRKLLNLYDSLS
ncbi:glycosyltransferase family 4 protein [Mangrovivirga cuniculi]|uniref:Glycosyl transferase family 1 n=1 Tax=Mangrovivirga cuniculi TaxID=2715131 RepID=A0A4D7JL98_9BACT|nr:glycosyltransferase family 4 protein [Mangrovivirga cuniculi]QCK16381.1 glycosyl transferase family 1 [Mangrovivirga cuniculi]